MMIEQLKNTARLLYIAHGVCFFFSLGTLNLIPLIINYIKRPEANGTFVYSHHSWMIRSLWFYWLWFVVGWILFATLFLIPLAWLVWAVAWLWEAYRLVRGFIDLNSNRAMS
ncbi:MAG: DUF4870 family protein [Telluria sp.]